MAKWFKLATLLVLATVFSSCGQASMHLKSLDLVPRFIVDNAVDNGQTIMIFSFNVPAMREGINLSGLSPKKAENAIGLVLAKALPQDVPEALDPSKMEGVAVCTQRGLQGFTNQTGLFEHLKKNGFIEEDEGGAKFMSKKYRPEEIVDLAPFCAIFDGKAVQVTSENEAYKDAVKGLALGETQSVASHNTVAQVMNDIGDFDAVALVFPFDSYRAKAETGSILGKYRPNEQKNLVQSFDVWGRTEFIRIIAVGARRINDAEQVRMVFLYSDDAIAQEEERSLELAINALPSMIDGRPWMEHMGFGNPVIKREGTKIVLECDMVKRGDYKGLMTMVNLDVAAKTGDWGLLWRK